ncbi:unnamed protein product [Gadus morhua 'NCC']
MRRRCFLLSGGPGLCLESENRKALCFLLNTRPYLFPGDLISAVERQNVPVTTCCSLRGLKHTLGKLWLRDCCVKLTASLRHASPLHCSTAVGLDAVLVEPPPPPPWSSGGTGLT